MAEKARALSPNSPEYLRLECRKHAAEVVRRYLDILRGPDHRAAFMAGKELLDRGFGKAPIMALDPADPDGMPAQLGYVLIPAKAET